LSRVKNTTFLFSVSATHYCTDNKLCKLSLVLFEQPISLKPTVDHQQCQTTQQIDD